MSKKITTETESRILKAAEAVTDYVSDGMDPTEAVIKSAKASALSAGHVRLLAQAYNTGVSNGIYKSGSNVAERTQAAPLADADVAIKHLFPAKGEIKIASATSYVFPKTSEFSKSQIVVEKTASIVKQTGTLPKLEDVISVIKEASAELTRKWSQTLDPEMKLESAITNIENHFRTPGAVSYSHFKRACELEYGHNASAILESLKIAEHLKKRAGDTSVAWHLAPYKYLAQAVEAGQKMASARMEAAQFDAEYGDKLIDIVQMVVPRKKSASLTDGIHVLTEVSIAEAERMLYGEVKKAADDDGGFDMSPTGLLGRLSYDPDAHASKEQIKVMRKLTDPVHEGRLNVLRRRFMLTNLMANDPVIKSYEPDDVLHIYNQLTQLAPRASGQEMLVQSILRRQLAQGQTDPHEVSQLTDIENKMKTIAEPSDSRKLPYVVNKLKNA